MLVTELVSEIQGGIQDILTGATICTAVVVARSTGPELWQEHTCLLHHDNAMSHTSVLTQLFLVKYIMTVIPQPPYSPDLAPVTSSYFQK
jgi:uncharacterized membrane protein YozB (DUF420 family)